MQRTLTMRPGINRQASQTLNEGGYFDSNRVRFRMGLPQKIGGWVRWSASTLVGACRAIHAWAQLNSVSDVAFGTNAKVYVSQLATMYDLTPVDRTLAVNASNVFTTIGQTVYAVTTVLDHGLTVGDYVTFDTITGATTATGAGRTPTGVTFNGIPLTGDVVVVAIGTSKTFYLQAASPATASGAYGSAMTVTCYLPTGRADVTPGTGWGAGGYGGQQSSGATTGWGIAAPSGTTLLPARFWSLDNWGEYLVAVPTQGAFYSFAPTSGAIVSRLTKVTNGGTPAYGPPLVNGGGFVAMPERHMVLLGCSDLNASSNYDPMLIRWSDKEDYTSWFALSSNAAGSARLQGGSLIVAAFNSQTQTLIWTDTSVFTMRFIGLPYVYRFEALGRNCGLIGQKAFAMLGGVVYWMSSKAFFRFRGGAPEMMASTLWDDVIDNLSAYQKTKIVCASNAAYGEVTWWYPSTNSSEPDRYVTLNTLNDCWYGGTMSRSAYVDADPLPVPLGVTPGGVIYQHETGTDDDGAPMGEYLLSGYASIAEGENIAFMRSFIPDFQGLTGTISLTIKTTMYPNTPARSRGPYSVTSSSTNINSRARGRQIAFRIDGGGVGSDWRMGGTRVDLQPDGSR